MSKLDPYILALLPGPSSSEPWLSTPKAAERLRASGLTVNHVKTVQRRLEKLEEQGAVISQQDGTALTWQRKEGATGLAQQAKGLMTFDEALALQMLGRFASRQLPDLVGTSLSGLFDVAKQRLSRTDLADGRKHTAWTKKVAVASAAYPLVRPKIKESIFQSVSNALFNEHLLEVRYRPMHKSDGAVSPHTLMPLGLVETERGVVYLVARTFVHGKAKPNPALYRLDRMMSVELLQDTFTYPRDFALATYVEEERNLEFFSERTETRVALRFRGLAANQILETPLSVDQETQFQDDGSVVVRGEVVLSLRFQTWLRSLGQCVEVLEPKRLRNQFRDEAIAIQQMYTESSGQ